MRKAMSGALSRLAVLVVAVSASSAHAAAVTQWGFEVNSGFSAFAPNGVTGSNNNAVLGLPSLLSWGTSTGSGQSSLGVGAASNGNFTGSLFTNGAAVNTVTVTHNNRPIEGTSLRTATLRDRITLRETSPVVGVPFNPPELFFDINFLETDNDGSCEVASPVPCNDIFVLDVPGAGFNPADNSLNQTFMYGGEDYNAILQISGLGVLTNAACAAVFGNNLHNGCIGFTTVEGQLNTFQVSLAISDTPFVVPEPVSLSLVGLGLLAMGAARRRPLAKSSKG